MIPWRENYIDLVISYFFGQLSREGKEKTAIHEEKCGSKEISPRKSDTIALEEILEIQGDFVAALTVVDLAKPLLNGDQLHGANGRGRIKYRRQNAALQEGQYSLWQAGRNLSSQHI
jgi:hypothetical protein